MKTALITGTSSGIGLDTVRVLVENGMRVIATVRSLRDAEMIKKKYPDQVIPLLLDVSNFAQLDQLVNQLKSEHQIVKLDALINNAGIAFAGPFANQDFNEIEKIIRVNVLGVMKMTQILIPLLAAGDNARIINISSVAGVSAAPFLSIYAASKHAIEGFSGALRKEMLLFGIKVIVIGPGSIKTPIWNKGFTVVKNKYEHTEFAKPFQKFIGFANSEEKNALEVTEVSKLILKAITSKNPSYRYAPVPRKWINVYLPKLIPQRLYNYLTAKTLGLNKRN